MILIVKGVAKVSKRGSTLVIHVPKKDKVNTGKITWEKQSIPLLDLELLIVVGSRVRISSGAVLMLSEANIPILIHGRRSNSFLINPFHVRIAEARRKLYGMSENPSWRALIGSAFIEGKITGLANLVRYLAYKDIEKGRNTKWILREVVDIESQRKEELNCIRDITRLRLYEAKWSKKLWELIVTFIPSEYRFTGRDPKSKDPINSAVSYAYAIIYGLCTHALIASGLDPYVGLVHTERAGRTSLTYDFSEMFKPVAVHAVTVASRLAKLTIDKNGYLTKGSLESVTRHVYRALRRKHRNWRYTVRGEIYAKAWELRQNIEKGITFKPFIYTVK